MFKHILMPVDGTEFSEHAIDAGIRFAQSIQARITGFIAEPALTRSGVGEMIAHRSENTEDFAYRFGTGAEAHEGGLGDMSKKQNAHIGSSLDDFLKDEGTFEEVQTQAIKEIVAWQLAEAMKVRGVSKAGMAKLLRTSRTQINRLLDPASDVTLSSLQRAAALVGRQVRLELV